MPDCSTSPGPPWTPPSALCCWPGRRRGWCASPTGQRATTPSCRPSPTGSARGCCAPRPAGTTPRGRPPRPRLSAAVRQLEEYFAGRRTAFELPLDLRLAAGFRRPVLTQLRQVGYGTTASYATVAAAAGSPRAVRAVGTACATNPLPVVVPCHRVVRSDGALGNYVGGVAAKRTLLALEAAA